MTTYFFNLIADGQEEPDQIGTDCSSNQEAILTAAVALAELLRDAPALNTSLSYEVIRDGERVAKIELKVTTEQ
jgi:hypothetical protein